MAKSDFLWNYVGYFSKEITKIREPFFADFLPKFLTEIRENQSDIYFKAILSIGIKFSLKKYKDKEKCFFT